MNVLLIGASGQLGSELTPILKEKYNWIVDCPSHSELDITNPPLWLNFPWDIVINLAAFIDIASAQKEPWEANRVNAECLDWLTRLPPRAQVYHISTDYVYCGYSRDSKETDILEPFNAYGMSKAAGDMRLLSFCNPAIHIIRLSFKPKIFPYPIAFENVFTNADRVDIIAAMLAEFISLSPSGGIWNLGTERKSLFELARRTSPHVQPGTMTSKEFPLQRPEVTMDLSKYNKFIQGAKQCQ